MKDSPAYYYYFPGVDAGTVFKHFHLYEREVLGARDHGIDIRMVCFIELEQYLDSWERIQKHRQKTYLDIVIVPHPKVKKFYATSYFLRQTLSNERLIVQTRKVATDPLNRAKQFVGDNIRYLVQQEGDLVAEARYLRDHTADGEADDGRVRHIKQRQRQKVTGADHIFAGTETLIERLDQRFSDVPIQSKTTHIPLGFPEHLGYDPELRTTKRSELGLEDRFVFLYLGSMVSWQNVDRTIELFETCQRRFDTPLFLILLIPEADHAAATQILDEMDIAESEYLLTEAPHDKMNAYLNAADLGIVLRDDHPMNRVSYPSKLIDYLAAGLPVLMTDVLKYSQEIKEQDFGIVVQDFADDDAVIEPLRDVFDYGDKKREQITQWARQSMEEANLAETYANALQELTRE